MSQVINTNVASLNAQRNLNESQGGLQTSLERLSSGLRINSAGDDAAGLAIAERFSAQISGLEQAQRNSNDGISFAQTAEGGLDEIGNLLQRVRELSVQAANDTNSNSDRAALNEEVQQAVAEVNRIAASTQFNDQNVLDGALEDLIFQVGANAGQTIGVDGVDARGSQLGAVIQETSGISDRVIAADPDGNAEQIVQFDQEFNFSELSGDGSFSVIVGGTEIDDLPENINTVEELAAALNAEGSLADDVEFSGDNATNQLTITNISGEEQEFLLQAQDGNDDSTVTASQDDFDDDANSTVGVADAELDVEGNADINGQLTVDGQTVNISVDAADVDDGEDVAAAVQEQLRDAGISDVDVNFNSDVGGGGNAGLEFENTGGGDRSIAVALSNEDNVVASAGALEAEGDRTLGEVFTAGDTADFTLDVDGTDIQVQGASNLDDVVSAINAQSQETGVSANLNATNDDIVFSGAAGEDFDVEITVTGQNGRDNSTQDINATAANDSVFVNDFDVTTRDNATETLTAVDFAIDQVNSLRGDLGATQNRFESTIANLSIGSENLQAARSRIVDADFASETADLTRAQILQQAGTSVLAQANQIPQNVVSLLQ